MSYQGTSRHNTWIFETLSGHSRLVELVGHTVPAPRIVRGVIPDQPKMPSLYFADVAPQPITPVTNYLIRTKVQFSVLMPHASHYLLDEAQRILRDAFNPEDHPSMQLGGLLRILYVNLSGEGGALYEDTARRCIRLDHRIDIGYLEI